MLRAKASFPISAHLSASQTRSATARIVLDNKDGRWRPRYVCHCRADGRRNSGTRRRLGGCHPDTARLVGGVRPLWKYFEARPLKLGRSDGKMVEVLTGLSAGEQYAAGNSFVIKAELGKSGASHDH